MRSELVFKALAHNSNRLQLCVLAAKGIRKLHRPHTRLQDTANDVLRRLSQSDLTVEAQTTLLTAPSELRAA
jgi:hypothetical protein